MGANKMQATFHFQNFLQKSRKYYPLTMRTFFQRKITRQLPRPHVRL
nr:MAG TPA: hypothetical protein [Caudoviricetes sp.]